MLKCSKCKVMTQTTHGMKIHLGRDHKLTGEKQRKEMNSIAASPVANASATARIKKATEVTPAVPSSKPPYQKREIGQDVLSVFVGLNNQGPCGWMCPVCRTVYSPFVNSCDKHVIKPEPATA